MPSLSFSLSLAAMDLLWDQLQLGTPVRIFEVPSVGETMADRDRIRGIVLEDLAGRNLAYRGRLEPEVEEALVTLGRFRTAVEVVAMLEDKEKVLARFASNGRTAVSANLVDQSVRFETLRPESVLAEAVKLIGDEKPGPGRSVTFPETQPSPPRRRRQDEGFSGVFDEQPDVDNYQRERRAAQTMWERPRKRIGMFTVYGRDRAGRELPLPVLSWFDTDEGRYLGHLRPGPDGRRWTTYSPADTARITQQLAGMLNAVEQPVSRPSR